MTSLLHYLCFYSFVFKAHAPFTRTGASTLYCQCSSAEVRAKWIETLERVLGDARVKVRLGLEAGLETEIGPGGETGD